MKVNPSGFVVAAGFYGLLWYAFESGVDYPFMRQLAFVALIVAAGWLSVGVITESPLSPFTHLRARRRDQRGGAKRPLGPPEQ